MGVALNNQNFSAKSNEVYNFSIYKYNNSNNKCSKYILQLNFQENILCLIKRGVRQRSYQLDSIKNIDTSDDSTRIIVQFENGSYIEIESKSLEEKNQLSHLLFSILNQDHHYLPILNSIVAKRERIILEGILEKKGRNAAFLKWTKRYVKVLPGEIMYFKVGDQENESTALNIISLTVGDVVLKRNFDSGFTLLVKEKEYTFRTIPFKNNNVELERDSWLMAIEHALNTDSNKKEEDFIDGIDQKQLYINAVNSITLQLKQFESVLYSIAPFQAFDHLKKIQDTVFLFSEQIKSKLFSNLGIYKESNNQIEKTRNSFLKMKNMGKPLNNLELPSTLPTTDPSYDETLSAVLSPSKDPSCNIPTTPPSNLMPILEPNNDKNLNIPVAPPFISNSLTNAPNATNLSNLLVTPFTVPAAPLFGLSPKLPVKSNEAPTCKIKPLFWNKLPDSQIMNSFWINSQNKTHLLNVKKLENLFHQVGQESSKKEPSKLSDLDCKNSQNVALLDQRKAQNLGIFLSGFKINETNIEEKLMMHNTSEGLTNEEIVALKRFHPTVDEIEMYKKYQGDSKKLTDIDKFMIKLCNIPNLAKRLDLLLTMCDLPDEIKSIKIPLKHLTNACLCLLENNQFTQLLEYILVLGNYMNGGTPRGAAYGFKLSVLTKLVDIKSYDKKHTLLDFIVEELWNIDKDAIYCYKGMQTLTTPIDFSLKNLMTEFQIMQKELLSLKEKSKGIEADLGEKLCKNINEFYVSYSAKLSKIEVIFKNVQNLYILLINKFGESSSLDVESWLSETGCFIKHLQIAVENVERKYKENNLHSLIKHSTSLLNETKPFNTSLNGEQSKRVDQSGNTQTDLNNTVNQNKGTNIYEQHSLKQYSKEIEQSNEKFVLSGFLEKLSGGKKRTAKWDLRYFELTENGYLQYFKKKGGTITGNIYLKGCPISLDPKDNCIINILQNDREWKLRGDKDVVISKWLKLLLHHAKKK
ncbi:formin-F-like [Hydra vulgaris]|uniref:formin-F-like n=1 Tax=Hydra vulgaris TaxID=6087 RepID=UPI000640CCBA|nr:formin-F-like isoform X3 [Hydra vulgaris]XP_047130516.1 formin-F-like isoform X3 [Hydra vulgaris]